MGPETTPPERWYTRTDAAKLCGRDRKTIKRYQEAGKLPNWRRRPGCPNGTIEYPLSDLVDAELYTPPADGEAPECTLSRVRAEQRILELTAELADAQARAKANEQLADHLTKQFSQLTRTVDRLATACAQGGDR